jgi:hypothetical protein
MFLNAVVIKLVIGQKRRVPYGLVGIVGLYALRCFETFLQDESDNAAQPG